MAGPESIPGPQAKRDRARARLSEAERERVGRILRSAGSGRDLPPFAAARTAYEKVLHALVAAGEPLSPQEVAYLLIDWWGFNTDVASVRRRVALAVQQGEVRSSGGDRYYATVQALEHLRAAGRRSPPAAAAVPPATSATSRRPRDGRPARKPGRRHDPAR